MNTGMGLMGVTERQKLTECSDFRYLGFWRVWPEGEQAAE
jgi:hypothetical protein